MTDHHAARLAAAKRRLAAAERTAEEVSGIQGENERRLAQLQAEVDALLTEDESVAVTSSDTPPPALPVSLEPGQDEVARYLDTSERYADGLKADREYLLEQGVDIVRWEDLLPTSEIATIEARLDRPVSAEPLDRGDLITIGVCAGLGAVAVLLDDQIDGFVKDRLCDLHKSTTSLGKTKLGKAVRRWDSESHRLAIDYSGKGIGEPGGIHRVRSTGHDLLRPFDAIRQIRSGEFVGHDWKHNVPVEIAADRPRPGFLPYRQIADVNEAILLWLKHLAADFTTDKSLPIPGATHIHDIPNHALRSFGGEAYKAGLNLRSVAVSGMLPVATVELGVRLTVHFRTWRETQSASLSPERRAKLGNMLLLSHGIVAGASAGKVAMRWGAEGPVALRHLNVAALGATARYALPAMTRYVRRDDPGLKYERNERELVAGWNALLEPEGFLATVHSLEQQPAPEGLTI